MHLKFVEVEKHCQSGLCFINALILAISLLVNGLSSQRKSIPAAKYRNSFINLQTVKDVLLYSISYSKDEIQAPNTNVQLQMTALPEEKNRLLISVFYN